MRDDEMITREIARNGMKGRKRVTLLLALVLVFTFLFIVVALTLEVSINRTKIAQKCAMYGSWQAAYMEADTDTVQKLQKEKDISKYTVSSIAGYSSKFGMISSISDEFQSMGRLNIMSGDYPKEKNEILISNNIANSLGLENPVGQTIELEINNSIVNIDRTKYENSAYQDLGDGYRGLGYNVQRFYTREQDGEYNVSVYSQYFYRKQSGDEIQTDPEVIRENGILYGQDITLSKEYVICGVVDNFSSLWDLGDFSIGDSFITEDAAKEIQTVLNENGLVDLSNLRLKSNVFLLSDSLNGDLYDSIKAKYLTQKEMRISNRDHCPFRKNTYTYSSIQQSTERIMTILVMVVIFVVTVCAVLQIFLTQIKRRTRKIALLKSIGMTNVQVIAMLLWEGIYLLILSMPIGVILGYVGTMVLIKGLNRFAGMDLTFYSNLPLLGVGVIAGCLSLFMGMLVPMRKALHVPLVGMIPVTQGRRKSLSTREKLKKYGENKQPAMLTFRYITKLHNKNNRRGTIFTKVLTSIMATAILVCIFAGYHSFDTYAEKVIKADRPNYMLSAQHGFLDHKIKTLKQEIQENPNSNTSRMDYYNQANGVYIKYDGMQDDTLYQAYKQVLPDKFYGKYIGVAPTDRLEFPENAELVNDSVVSSIYGINSREAMYQEVMDAVTVGEIDEEKFLSGEQVILAIPLYQKSGEVTESSKDLQENSLSQGSSADLSINESLSTNESSNLGGDSDTTGNEEVAVENPQNDSEDILDTLTHQQMFSYILKNKAGIEVSYDAKFHGYYQEDSAAVPGRLITLAQECEYIGDGRAPVRYNWAQTEIGGIIYYTPKGGMYPLFQENNGFIVIGSDMLLAAVCPDIRIDPMKDQSEDSITQFEFKLSQRPYNYGQSYLNIYTNDRVNAVDSANYIFKLAREYGFSFTNYNEQNWEIYYKAFNIAMIIAILGITSSLIAIMILYNINMSAFDQERSRIGVLQALGVTYQQFRNSYIMTGVRNGFYALIMGHAVLALIAIVRAIMDTRGMAVGLSGLGKNIIEHQLMYYPWPLHLSACILMFVIVVWINYIPVRQLKNFSPNENIRG